MKLFLAILLALVPIFVWIINRRIAKRKKRLKLLKKHITIYYTDLLFVIFNFLLIYSVAEMSAALVVWILIISCLTGIAMHVFWTKLSHDHLLKYPEMATIHAAYFVFQFILIIIFLLSDSTNYLFTSINLFLLGAYFMSYFFVSGKINPKALKSDMLMGLLGLVVVVLKGVLLLH